MFEAWIRLMPNEFETYTFFLFSRYFGPDWGVSSGSKLCLALAENKVI